MWNNEEVSRQRLPDLSSPSLPPPAVADGAAISRAAENPLSEREMDVARLLVTGANNNDIAGELFISPLTVKVHLRNIYEKLGVNSRTEASLSLVSQGWVSLPGVDTPLAVADAKDALPEPLAASSGTPFLWQRFYLLVALLVSLGVLFTPFFTRPVESLPTLLSDGDAMALGRPVIAEMPRWESRAPLSKARSRLALVAFNDTALYAIGGESSQGQPLPDVDVYDLRVNEWRSVAALPLALANAAVATDGAAIVVAGGSTSGDAGQTISDLLLRYAPAEDAWREWGRLPLPLAGASLLLAGDAVYLVGGWDGQSMRDEVWRIPASADGEVMAADWQVITRMESGRAFAGAVAVADDLYVVGGYDGRRELDDARSYNRVSGEWRELPHLATPRGGISLLYDGLALFAVGGGWTRPVDTIERFDPATGLWSNFPAPISSEWRHLGGAASPLGQLYLIGGWSSSYLDIHLRYQSSFRTFFPSTQKDGAGTPTPQK